MSFNNISDKTVPVPTGRVSRFAKVGGLAADIAGNLALNGVRQLVQGQRPNWNGLLLSPANARKLADQLAQMRGAAMKVGQLMSMDSGTMLPPEFAQILARLRSEAQSMPPLQLKKVLTAYWGPSGCGNLHPSMFAPSLRPQSGKCTAQKPKMVGNWP